MTSKLQAIYLIIYVAFAINQQLKIEKKAEEIIVKPSIPMTQHQPQKEHLQDEEEIDFETIKKLEEELVADKNSCFINKSLLVERV